MNSKSQKLFDLLEALGFWRENIPKQDLHKNGEPTYEHAENTLNIYLNQLEERLYLLEWLLTQLDKNILRDYVDESRRLEYDITNEYRIRRVKDIMEEKGLLWSSKFAKNLDFHKAVEGIAGTEVSYQIVYQLAKFVSVSRRPHSLAEEIDGNRVLRELCQHKDELVNQKVNYFPLDFPRKYEFSPDEVVKKIQQLKENMKEDTLRLEDEFINIQRGDDNAPADIQYASAETKAKYAKVINEFRKTMDDFVEDFRLKKLKMKNLITKFESNKIDVPEDFAGLFGLFAEKQFEIENDDKQLQVLDLDERIAELSTSIKAISN